MQEWLALITEYTVVVFDTMALVVIVYGTAEAFVVALGLMIRPRTLSKEQSVVWRAMGAGWWRA